MHGVERYGLATMRTFRFEVWNEFWGMPLTGNTTNFSPYMRLYNASAVAIKSADSSLQVGGPSSNGGVCCIDTFVKVANAMKAPYDFVSGHIYPIESFCPDPDGGPGWTPDCLLDRVKPIADNVSKVWAPGKPLLITEFAVAGVNEAASAQLDSSSAAAFAFRTIGKMAGVTNLEVLSWWTFSGVFEERSATDQHAEFSNNFGLITPRGIRKPGWRGFELLHTHAGGHRLRVGNSNDTAIYAMATSNASLADAPGPDDSLRVFLSFWAAPNQGTRPNAARAVSPSAAAPPPPAVPGFNALDGDWDGHNLDELVDETVFGCGVQCNQTGGCEGYSFQFGPGVVQPHENCVLKSSNCGGHAKPSPLKFVFYERITGPPPPPTPPPSPAPPPIPAQPRTAAVKLTAGVAPSVCSEVRIDEHNANAHTAYVEMGRPSSPTAAQMARLHAASELHSVPCRTHVDALDGSLVVDVLLQPDTALVLVFSSTLANASRGHG